MLAFVADDDASIQKLARRCLEELGCAVEVFDNADALLKASRLRNPDLVISDIEMPGALNGLEACRLIRAKKWKLPIVLMTGRYDNLLDVGEGEFDLILIKPFAMEQLQKAASALLRQQV